MDSIKAYFSGIGTCISTRLLLKGVHMKRFSQETYAPGSGGFLIQKEGVQRGLFKREYYKNPTKKI